MAQIGTVNAFISDPQEIILAGNMLNTEVETPRQDASMGLMLSLQKDGSWKTVAPEDSGLFLSGEVKHLEKITVAGKEMILVVRNNGWLDLIGKE